MKLSSGARPDLLRSRVRRNRFLSLRGLLGRHSVQDESHAHNVDPICSYLRGPLFAKGVKERPRFRAGNDNRTAVQRDGQGLLVRIIETARNRKEGNANAGAVIHPKTHDWLRIGTPARGRVLRILLCKARGSVVVAQRTSLGNNRPFSSHKILQSFLKGSSWSISKLNVPPTSCSLSRCQACCTRL